MDQVSDQSGVERVLERPSAGPAGTGAPAGPRSRPRVVRLLRHEWFLAAAGSVLLAVLMTWPLMRDPAHTFASDFWDPSLQAWQLSWMGWALLHSPGQFWDTNAHFGESWSFAYSDTLLGYLPFGLIGSGSEAAVLRYNLLFLLAFAGASFGAYVLARQLGANRAGSLVAGLIFAYAPWRYAHMSHLNILSIGGIALSLAMLARGHGYSLRHGYRPAQARPAWALGGWLVAAWQITLGFGLGLPFGYVLGALTAASVLFWLVKRPPFGKRLFRADLAGVLIFLAAVGLMAIPYLRMQQAYPGSARTLAEINSFSGDVRQFVTAPGFEWLWGRDNQELRDALIPQGGGEVWNLPGFFAIGLAGLGLVVSAWSRRHRVLMLLAAFAFAWVGMGMRAPWNYGYQMLHHWLPGWDAIRTPGRLILWVTLLLGLLAAGLITALAEQLTGRVARPVLAVLLLLPAGLVVLEGVQITPFRDVPKAPVALGSLAQPVLVLPTDKLADLLVMLWSTDGFPTVANGSSGYIPPRLEQLRATVASFPDAASVRYLRDRGIRTVVVPRRSYSDPVPPATFTKPVDGLGITREERGDAVVFGLG
ncbi:hypothetical protein [Actinoplanes awajinensis]|uniref:Glycosyltransferase RgtA/B/C/D-like domain-containing protein n=1 Tax=Actinoplanes awajinensis subsp. mycoplanecinus TaxID=135947 RepID=A0A0X3VC28_9ACTN|nr:hypothetical protein [Actinoplanes awajinensis]KUL42349.1 hypothetical protein ADL15_00195 [Actinoplanes awajinensis subsp. mycoplanecinus]